MFTNQLLIINGNISKKIRIVKFDFVVTFFFFKRLFLSLFKLSTDGVWIPCFCHLWLAKKWFKIFVNIIDLTI